MFKSYILIILLSITNTVMADERKNIYDHTGKLLGWTYTEPNGKEKAYHKDKGLQGWYNPNTNRTYKFNGTIYSFGNRVDSLIDD